MAKQQLVDTVVIAEAIETIQSTDNVIDQYCEDLRKEATKLNSWKGKAAEAARTNFLELLKYNETRSDALGNYVKFLNEQVIPGYVQTETVNKSLADYFK